MRFVLITLLSLFFSIPAWAEYTLAVFGDSLSAGYHLPQKDSFYAQLEKALQEKGYDIRVLNASKSGETTAGGVRKVSALLSRSPDGVILELGINDTFRSTPIATIKNNLKSLIETFQNHHIAVLLAGMKTTPNKSASYQQQFEEMYQDLAAEYSLELYPFFMDGVFDAPNPKKIPPQNDKLLPDGIHPNARGVSIMVRGILPTVERFLMQQGVKPQKDF